MAAQERDGTPKGYSVRIKVGDPTNGYKELDGSLKALHIEPQDLVIVRVNNANVQQIEEITRYVDQVRSKLPPGVVWCVMPAEVDFEHMPREATARLLKRLEQVCLPKDAKLSTPDPST